VDVPWTLPALRWDWSRAKETVAPWWRENSKEAYAAGSEGLTNALKAWPDRRKGRRRGRRMGFPRFRKKGRGRESVGFTTGAIRLDDQSHVVLPRIGRVRTHEPTWALWRRLEEGTAQILRATVAREGGRRYASFTCEVKRDPGSRSILGRWSSASLTSSGSITRSRLPAAASAADHACFAA
jgi:putative transposase